MTSSQGFSALVTVQSSKCAFTKIQWDVNFIHYIKKVIVIHSKGNFVILKSGLPSRYSVNKLLLIFHVPYVLEPA